MKKEKFIYERNGAAYVVIIKWTTTAGDRRQKQIGTYSVKKYGSKTAALKEAKKARDKALVDIELERISDQIFTVDRLFQDSQRLLVHNIKTRERHQSTYNALMTDQLRNTKIEAVTNADVQLSINRFAEGHTQDAIKRALTVWRLIFRAAMINDLIIPDRTRAVIVPKSQVQIKRREKFCTHEELKIFLEALLTYGYGPKNEHRNIDIYVMIQIMMYCGIRPQEVLALTVADIDLVNQILQVNKSIGSTDQSKRQVVTTKTPESIRSVPIPDELASILEDFVKDKTGMLFLDVDRKPYEITTIADYIARVSRKAGVKVTMYMLRHMFATDLAKITDPKTLQTLMGHVTPTMSLGYADKTSLADCAEALRRRKLS